VDTSGPVVVVGASAGGVEALTELVRALPPDLHVPVAIVLHMAPGGTSVLAGILDRASALPAVQAEDGMPLVPGRVHVACPDFHLLVEDGVLRLDPGPRENGHRPAVDPLFRSAAQSHGPAVIAVVLSGSRDDGTAGAAAVRAAGGRVAIQDPETALYASMPANVERRVGADATGTPRELAGRIRAWSREEALMTEDPPETVEHEAGEPGSTGLTCPECGGAIYLDEPDGVPQLACHTGHVYSPDSFAEEQERELEAALWGAVRRLDERAALLRRLVSQLSPDARPGAGSHFEARASEAQRQAETIRELIARRVNEAA
jgi:two-component system chemotaxis response regulator CheB